MGSSMVTIGQSALGAGLFAAQALQPGQAILLLSGAVLSRDEIVALGSERSYAIQIGPDEYLDTMPPGRYANHSCNPNAGIKNDRVLMALRPVAAGEEIRFDYSTAMGRGHWTTECRCGEPSGGDPRLPSSPADHAEPLPAAGNRGAFHRRAGPAPLTGAPGGAPDPCARAGQPLKVLQSSGWPLWRPRRNHC